VTEFGTAVHPIHPHPQQLGHGPAPLREEHDGFGRNGVRNCRTVEPSSWGVKLTVGRFAPLIDAKGSMAAKDLKTGIVPAPCVLKKGCASAPTFQLVLGGDGGDLQDGRQLQIAQPDDIAQEFLFLDLLNGRGVGSMRPLHRPRPKSAAGRQERGDQKQTEFSRSARRWIHQGCVLLMDSQTIIGHKMDSL